MCLDGGAFLFLQDSTQWRLSLQTEQIQVLRHRHLPDRHDAAPVIVAHIQIQKRLHQFSVEEAEGMAIILVPVSFAMHQPLFVLFYNISNQIPSSTTTFKVIILYIYTMPHLIVVGSYAPLCPIVIDFLRQIEIMYNKLRKLKIA